MKAKKIFFLICLIGYIYLLYRIWFLTPRVLAVEGTGFFFSRFYSELIKNGNLNYLRSLGINIAVMFPIGLLFPLTKGKKCMTDTMVFGAFLATLSEVLQFIFNRGVTCFDDILFAAFGSWIGYKFFIFACKHTSDGKSFLHPLKEKSKVKLAVYLFVTVILFSVLVNIKNGTIGTPVSDVDINNISTENREETALSNIIIPSANESVYETIYTSIKSHKTSFQVSGIKSLQSSDDIFAEFERVLDDHPELFWMTGAAKATSYSMGPTVEYIITPKTNCDISGVPDKEEKLNDVVYNVTLMAKTFESDYDKAAFVHDYIAGSCEYDINSYYSSLYAKNDQEITSHAFDSYGCLVEHCAVCVGYARAYKLIMNQLGIECDVVTGQAINDAGSGPHAWNSVVIDGQKYYVDVTWDDPITIGYTPDTVRRDYFMVPYEVISKDHVETDK